MLLDVVSSVGFPIAVCVYLLVSFRGTLDKLRDVIARNNDILSKLIDKIGG